MEASESGHGYQYEPLPSSNGYIRLLSLLPRGRNGDIRLSLRVVKLDEVDGMFDALSYVWGPKGNEKRVGIDETYAVLRPNLWNALEHCYSLRRNNVGHLLWVDALCINQSDMAERGAQVRQMKHIYSRAHHVLIWLGENSKAEFNVDMVAPDRIYREKPSLREVAPLAHEWFHNLSKADQDAIVSIACNEYWARVWVTQENVLARDAMVIMGTTLQSLPSFFDTAVMIESLFSVNDSITHHWSELTRRRCVRMFNMSVAATSRSYLPESLLGVLRKFYKGECYDSRDQIYGLLGLIKDGDRFSVSYDITDSELFWRTLSFVTEGMHFDEIWALFDILDLTSRDVLPTKDHLSQYAEPTLLLFSKINRKIVIQPEKQGFSPYRICHLNNCSSSTSSLPRDAQPSPMFFCRYSKNVNVANREYLCISLVDGFGHHEPLNKYQPALLVDSDPAASSFLLGCFIYTHQEPAAPGQEIEALIYIEEPRNSLDSLSTARILDSIDLEKVRQGMSQSVRIPFSGIELIGIYDLWNYLREGKNPVPGVSHT